MLSITAGDVQPRVEADTEKRDKVKGRGAIGFIMAKYRYLSSDNYTDQYKGVKEDSKVTGVRGTEFFHLKMVPSHRVRVFMLIKLTTRKISNI